MAEIKEQQNILVEVFSDYLEKAKQGQLQLNDDIDLEIIVGSIRYELSSRIDQSIKEGK